MYQRDLESPRTDWAQQYARRAERESLLSATRAGLELLGPLNQDTHRSAELIRPTTPTGTATRSPELIPTQVVSPSPARGTCNADMQDISPALSLVRVQQKNAPLGAIGDGLLYQRSLTVRHGKDIRRLVATEIATQVPSLVATEIFSQVPSLATITNIVHEEIEEEKENIRKQLRSEKGKIREEWNRRRPTFGHRWIPLPATCARRSRLR